MKRVPRYNPKATIYYNDTGEEIDSMMPVEDGEWVRYEDIPSWNMLMDILDAVYPAEIFTGASGDSGPLIIVKLREIDELRKK